MVSSKTAFLRAQRRWADARSVRYDAHGCVHDLGDNLRVPLDDKALEEFRRGSELTPGTKRPARVFALCSSAALVINVFGFWRGRDHTPLLAALGIGGPGGTLLKFEQPLPTGLPGDPPTVDVALYRPDGRCVAVESKLAEWLTPRPRRQRAFKDKYFHPTAKVWEAAGLPRCQALAEDLQEGRERLKHVNAPQLLKHALGLASSGLRTSTLLYLYYDWPGRESVTHRAELERVLERVVPEVDLRVGTYQAAFAALRDAPGLPRDYVDYLAQRYFP